MKKLLTLLGTVGITAGGAGNAVAFSAQQDDSINNRNLNILNSLSKDIITGSVTSETKSLGIQEAGVEWTFFKDALDKLGEVISATPNFESISVLQAVVNNSLLGGAPLFNIDVEFINNFLNGDYTYVNEVYSTIYLGFEEYSVVDTLTYVDSQGIEHQLNIFANNQYELSELQISSSFIINIEYQINTVANGFTDDNYYSNISLNDAGKTFTADEVISAFLLSDLNDQLQAYINSKVTNPIASFDILGIYTANNNGDTYELGQQIASNDIVPNGYNYIQVQDDAGNLYNVLFNNPNPSL